MTHHSDWVKPISRVLLSLIENLQNEFETLGKLITHVGIYIHCKKSFLDLSQSMYGS